MDIKKFWKMARLFLSDKSTVFLQISIDENNQITTDGFDLSKEFSTFFEDAVR